MIEFNRAERRALLLGSTLVALGTGVRLLTGPSRGDYAWRSGPGGSEMAERGEMRTAVEIAVAKEERAGTPLGPGEQIDPTTAAEEELRRLPGIGPARARAILDERSARPFTSVEDLLRVPGIGPTTLARLRPHLTEPPPDGQGHAPRARVRVESAAACRPVKARTRQPLDLNTADTSELVQLPGVGPARARAIVDLRKRRGRLRSPEELLEIDGIGRRTLERLRSLVCTG